MIYDAVACGIVRPYLGLVVDRLIVLGRNGPFAQRYVVRVHVVRVHIGVCVAVAVRGGGIIVVRRRCGRCGRVGGRGNAR